MRANATHVLLGVRVIIHERSGHKSEEQKTRTHTSLSAEGADYDKYSEHEKPRIACVIV